jgi:hypothetical protein
VRFGNEVWSGLAPSLAWRFVGGLGNALFGARDGVFVMVPVASVAALGVPWLWRRNRPAAVVLAALFASVWWAAALHGGGAPGPPGRLLSPAAPLFAAPLAVAIQELRRLLSFRWSVAAAATVSIVVVVAMGAHPRRTQNPYRGLVGEVGLMRDLPAGRADPAGAALDATRAGLFLAVIGFWAWRFRRGSGVSAPAAPAGGSSPAVVTWHEAVAFQAGAWLTLALCAAVLHALTVLTGG